jgi:uncharacterized protein (TIGR00251 family)
VSALRVTARATGIRVSIRVQPRSTHPGVGGVHGDALKVRVGAAPVDGAANDSVIDVLAKAFAVSRSAVKIVSGHTARAKVVDIAGATIEDAKRLAAQT